MGSILKVLFQIVSMFEIGGQIASMTRGGIKFMQELNALKIVPSDNKEIALGYIWSFIGTWYKWGGDDPSAIDCSGLALEYLKSAGLVDRGVDMTAAGIWGSFKLKKVDKPYRGCLVFWANSEGKIIHVEVMLNDELAIGASGGGSKTLTVADAIRDNAFVKIRKADTRKGIIGYIDPFKK